MMLRTLMFASYALVSFVKKALIAAIGFKMNSVTSGYTMLSWLRQDIPPMVVKAEKIDFRRFV